jgi:hypothetical protein
MVLSNMGLMLDSFANNLAMRVRNINSFIDSQEIDSRKTFSILPYQKIPLTEHNDDPNLNPYRYKILKVTK